MRRTDDRAARASVGATGFGRSSAHDPDGSVTAPVRSFFRSPHAREPVPLPNTATHPALERAVHHTSIWLDGLDTRSVGATASLEELRARLGLPHRARDAEPARRRAPPDDPGADPARICVDLAAATEGGLLGSPRGRFFAWVIGGTLPSALAADWLTSAWDQNAGMYATAPAAAIAEEVAGRWLLELLDLPRESSFAFVTGCQMAHVTALAAARSGVLARVGWDVEKEGLFGAPPIRVLANATRHSTIDRALRFLGIGERAVTAIPTDGDGRVTEASL